MNIGQKLRFWELLGLRLESVENYKTIPYDNFQEQMADGRYFDFFQIWVFDEDLCQILGK